MPHTPHEPTPPQALSALRVIWAMLVISQFTFLAIVLLMRTTYRFEFPPDFGPTLSVVAVGLLVVLTPLAYFIRAQVYKAHWRADAITPRGYVLGNVLLLGLLEGVSFMAVVAVLLGTGRLWPVGLGVLAAAVLIQALNFPTGRPMEPARPPFTDPQQ